MNFKILIVAIVLLYSASFATDAQSLDRQVIGSAGRETQNVDWTIGEVFTSSLGSASTILSQGFHQSFPQPDNVGELQSSGSILIYPNPSRYGFYIDFSGLSAPVLLDIYDAEGRLIESHQLSNTLHFWQANYAAGVYLLRISSQNGELVDNERLIILN